MKKDIKKSIQESIKSEVLKEDIFGGKALDPIAGAAGAIANVGRGIMGNLRLGSINSKINRSAQRLEKDWEALEKDVQSKSEKMASSKNPSVARQGRQVQANMNTASDSMKDAISKVQGLAAVGAETDQGFDSLEDQEMRGLGFKKPTGFEKWLRKQGVDPKKLGKIGYDQVFISYLHQMEKQGISVKDIDAKQLLKHVAPKAKSGNKQVTPEEAMEAAKEQHLQPKIPSKEERMKAAQSLKKPEQAPVQQPQHQLSNQDIVDIAEKAAQKIIQKWEAQHQAPMPPQEKQKTENKALIFFKRLASKAPEKISDMLGKVKQPLLQKGTQMPPKPKIQMPRKLQGAPELHQDAPIPLVRKKEEAAPIPLTKRKQLPGAVPGAQEHPVDPLAAKKEKFLNMGPRKGEVPYFHEKPRPKINPQGEIQVGDEKKGQSATVPVKDKIGKTVPKKKSARAKKKD